jgi:hypothetical protein
MSRIALAFLLSLLAVSRCLAITGGKPADGRFDWVVLLSMKFSNGNYLCTGSVISPYLVLTAAHCLVPTSAQGKLLSLSIQQSRKATLKITAGLAYVPPGYVADGSLEHDIGVLVLTDPIYQRAPPFAATPLDILWERYAATHENRLFYKFAQQVSDADFKEVLNRSVFREPDGRVAAFHVGFGLTRCANDPKNCTGRPDRPFYIGKYLSRATTCDRPFNFLEDTGPICSLDDASATFTTTSIESAGIQHGDSGGPLVVFDFKNKPIIIGINSHHVRTNGKGYVGAVNLGDNIDFLRCAIGGVSDKAKCRVIDLLPDFEIPDGPVSPHARG